RRLFTGFVRDISERKRAEARREADERKLAELAQSLAEKNKELETIVYVASHDLRSPLVNIQGFSKELIQACDQLRRRIKRPETAEPEVAKLLGDEIPEALHYIQAGVAKIDLLLAGFLRYSRLGRAELNLQALDMNELVAAVVRTLEFQIKQAGAS